MVHGRKHSYRLYTKMLNEAMRWVSAIQSVIENKAPIETPTQQLIRDIKVKIYCVKDDMCHISDCDTPVPGLLFVRHVIIP